MQVMLEVQRIMRGDLFNLSASPSAALFPGSVPVNAMPVTVTLTLNATYMPPPYKFWYGGYPGMLWLSTGLYAPPGHVINVTINTTSAIGKGLIVQVMIMNSAAGRCSPLVR